MTVENCQPKTAENFENCQAKMTLDEVIAQHEYCLTLGFTACGDCKYRDTDGVCKMREKALYYLKEYKIKRERIFSQVQVCNDREQRLQEEIARYQEAVRNCEEAENKYRMLKGELEGFPSNTGMNIRW